MKCYAGIDVSLDSVSVCIVDDAGKVRREAKVACEPDALVAWFRGLDIAPERIGLEAGPLSQWLHAGLQEEGLAVELLETRHVRTAFKTMPVKTDRKDARGIAQLMRIGWFRPVHCKSLAAQEIRALLGTRKLMQNKLHDIELSVRGTLRGFGLKVGKTTPKTFESAGPRPGGRPPDAAGGCRSVVARPHGAGGAIERTRSGLSGGARQQGGAAADDSAWRGLDRGTHLRLGDRRSQPVQIVQECRTAVGPDPQKIPVRRDGRDRADLQVR